VKGLGDREDGRALPIRVGRVFVIVTVIVVSRVIVTVLADVEVEVEEAGAEFSVPMPIAGRVETETTDADGRS